MTTKDFHVWWSRLRHQGLLLSPVVMLERYPSAPERAPFYVVQRLRNAFTRFASTAESRQGKPDLEQPAILAWVDSLLEHYVGHAGQRLARQHAIPDRLTAVIRVGSRSDTIRPHRVVYADDEGKTQALLVMADTSPQVGRGRGRTVYARLLELLRATGHRLGLLTNGHQFRLVYAGLDFESWCEWEADRWFDDGDGTEELNGLRQLLSPASLKPAKEGVSGLLDAVEESRKRQADLSSVLRENVRQAVELLLEEVSAANRTNDKLFAPLVAATSDRPLTDAEAHDALFQATVRVVMRLVVCLFAESRPALKFTSPVYDRSYGVRTLYELLEETTRHEGGAHGLLNRQAAWPRLMALFRLLHQGSVHPDLTFSEYGGLLFRPGDANSADPVSRSLYILELAVPVCDATIYHVLRKLLRGPLPVLRGRAKTFVEGPVDYTDLRTEFIGLIYEGLLDYRLKRTDKAIGPQVFLNIGREPVLPLARLEDILRLDKKGLRDLLTTLRKEKVTASAADEGEGDAEEEQDEDQGDDETTEEPVVEAEAPAAEGVHGRDYLDAVEAARRWATEAVVLAGLIGKQGKRETDSEYQNRIEAEANRLIKRVVAVGEFYLVRAGNTRKGTGTFYTRPQLAVPTVHRTLEPLCYEPRKVDDGQPAIRIPKEPDVILGLKACDPACGSASFLVAVLHYLTDALYHSLCFHRHLDDSAAARKLTLPYGKPRTGADADELVPFPPDDPQRGHTFEDRIKALLRRHVVERCIYGVDINPLAVELARVSLWVETLDPELPFSFLDHKIKVGNSLVGCWLDRVLDYPILAWKREGGDGKDGERTRLIKSFLAGTEDDDDGQDALSIKKEMREVIESQFSGTPPLFDDPKDTAITVVADARRQYESLHNFPPGDPTRLEAYYRDHVQKSESLCRLRRAMDEWCAVWFWPTTVGALALAPSPAHFHESDDQRDRLIDRLGSDLRFFHWEIEFPDVFTPQRAGFDALIGNPPWDVIEPKSQEFFSEIEPLYRTYDKQTALRRQKELFQSVSGLDGQWLDYVARFKALANYAKYSADPFDLSLDRGKRGKQLAVDWAKYRHQHTGFADARHPFRLLGTGKQNSYKLFTEAFWNLLRGDGRLGVILPTGIYSDFGTKCLREELLLRGRLEFLYAFQNEKKIFAAADHRYKQTAVFATRGGRTQSFRTRFRMGVGDSPEAHQIPDDILGNHDAAMVFTPDDVRTNSPKTLSLVELKSQRDLDIFRTIYAHSIRIGDNAPGWEITYAQEINMTSDSKHFPPLEKWEAKGYRPDVFGRWIGPDGDVALPLYEGRMIGQFDCSQKGWVSGKGRKAVWREIPFDSKRIEPQFLMSEATFIHWEKAATVAKLGIMDITSSTNTRTMIAVASVGFPFGHSAPVVTVAADDLRKTLYCSSVLDSFAFDFSARPRVSGVHFTWFILEECPIPVVEAVSAMCGRLAMNAACLTFLHRRFAPEWLRLKHLYPELVRKEWKHWWAVTEADRLRLRVEIDALCAHLYGLTSDDFDWIVRDDPTDPKGFYRVDRHLPFRERLTGLAAAAFRALKDEKWSAASAAKLSNDEFFALLGIPELTAGPDPLIRKRDGCHRWEPETFGPDDPRHGWTWDHCWQDAVALLGSEAAVREYVEGKVEQPAGAAEGAGPTDLFGNPLPAKQRRLFG